MATRPFSRVKTSAKAARFAASLFDDLDFRNPSFRLALVQAFAAVPRECFVANAFLQRAYDDVALPIGFGQTISRPSTLARMFSELNLNPRDKVLEIGAGSGYAAAILSALNLRVVAIEKISRLAQEARRRLDLLGFTDILLRCGDGLYGWKDEAPFSAIIFSAAFREFPTALAAQVENGGCLIGPIGDNNSQQLYFYRVFDSRVVEKRDLGPCQFVLGQRIGNSGK